MRLVRGEIVPEVVEVGALMSLHEGFGRRPVKSEMPGVGVVVNARGQNTRIR